MLVRYFGQLVTRIKESRIPMESDLLVWLAAINLAIPVTFRPTPSCHHSISLAKVEATQPVCFT